MVLSIHFLSHRFKHSKIVATIFLLFYSLKSYHVFHNPLLRKNPDKKLDLLDFPNSSRPCSCSGTKKNIKFPGCISTRRIMGRRGRIKNKIKCIVKRDEIGACARAHFTAHLSFIRIFIVKGCSRCGSCRPFFLLIVILYYPLYILF